MATNSDSIHALAEDYGYFGVALPKSCSKKHWVQYLDQLKGVARKINDVKGDHDAHGNDIAFERDKLNWEIGDYLVRGRDEKFEEPEKTRRRIAKAFKMSKGTLSNLMTVCDVFRDRSRRRENLTFSHHVVVAKRKLTPEEQDRALDTAEGFRRDENGKKIPFLRNKQKLSVRQLADNLSRDMFGKKIDAPTHEIIKIKAPIASYERLVRLTAVVPESRGHVAGLIWHLAHKYITEHKAELDASLKVWDDGAPEREKSMEGQKAIDEREVSCGTSEQDNWNNECRVEVASASTVEILGTLEKVPG